MRSARRAVAGLGRAHRQLPLLVHERVLHPVQRGLDLPELALLHLDEPLCLPEDDLELIDGVNQLLVLPDDLHSSTVILVGHLHRVNGLLVQLRKQLSHAAVRESRIGEDSTGELLLSVTCLRRELVCDVDAHVSCDRMTIHDLAVTLVLRSAALDLVLELELCGLDLLKHHHRLVVLFLQLELTAVELGATSLDGLHCCWVG